jgi:hypothetical protein
MSQFIQVIDHWINLDQVTSIQLVPSRKDDTGTTTALVRVHYSSGKAMEFKQPDSIQILTDFLENHRAK